MAARSPERSTAEASSSMHDEQLSHTIQKLQKPQSKSSNRKSRRSDGAENVKGCNCAGKVAGDCAAVCCCPCVIVHLLIVALVKLPFATAKKAFFSAKKMASNNKKSESKKKSEENDNDDGSGDCRDYSPSWSFRESPQVTERLEVLPSPKFDTQKMWSELYASGRMGFGGVPRGTSG